MRITLTTAMTPGAVAILQLHGRGAADVLRNLTGRHDWPASRLRYVRFAEIDSGLAVLLRDDWAQLMPHSGPRVVRKLIDALVAAGGEYDAQPSPRELYPEASSDIEADMLVALAQAASPAAIDLLLKQPENWRRWLDRYPQSAIRNPRSAILQRSRILNRLIDPPTVVVVGRPNVGKSTLTNRMLGRSASLVADLPGTTRDWVAGIAEISGISVRWLDTPGIRPTDDPIERNAIALAHQVIREADVLIAMRDPKIDWPDASSLPRTPDIRVMNKIDQRTQSPGTPVPGSAPLPISAATGEGTQALELAIIQNLGLSMLDVEEPWAFSDTLRTLLENADLAGIRRYIGAAA